MVYFGVFIDFLMTSSKTDQYKLINLVSLHSLAVYSTEIHGCMGFIDIVSIKTGFKIYYSMSTSKSLLEIQIWG